VIRVEVQAWHRVARRERDRHVQLCVPLVNINGPSYRLKDRFDLTTGGEPMP